jgi:hypothetical protein
MEFKLTPADGLQSFRGVSLVYRRVDPEAGGYRVGLDLSGSLFGSDADITSSEIYFEEDSVYMEIKDEVETDLTVFWDRISFHGTSRTVRLATSWGLFLGHGNELNDLVTVPAEDSSTISRARQEEVINWTGGFRVGLGMEWRLADDLVLIADSGFLIELQRSARSTFYSSSISENINGRVTYRVDIATYDASLGVVLYFD